MADPTGTSGPSRDDVKNAEDLNKEYSEMRNTLRDISFGLLNKINEEIQDWDDLSKSIVQSIGRDLNREITDSLKLTKALSDSEKGIGKSLTTQVKVQEQIRVVEERKRSVMSLIEELRSEALDIEDYILGSSIISSLCRLYLLFGQNDRAMSFCGQLEGLAQIECLFDIQKDLTRKFNTMINTESFFELQLSSVENFKHEDRIYAYKLMLHDLFNMDSSIISNDHDIVIYRVRRILHEVLVIFGKVEIFNYSSFQNFFHLLSKLPSEITLVSSMNDLVAIIELIPFRPERCEAWESLFGINFSESHVIMAMKAGNEIHDESIKLEFYDALIDSIPIHFWSSDWIYQFSYILKDDLLSLEKALHGFAHSQTSFVCAALCCV